MKTKRQSLKPLSLNPLSFDEAVTDILKVGRPPKPPKKKPKAKRQDK